MEVMVLPMTAAVIGSMLGFGGLQELHARGTWSGERQPLGIGAVGIGLVPLVHALRSRESGPHPL